MSDATTIIQEISDDDVSTYVLAATLALLIYDSILTLQAEIRYTWCKLPKLGAILYLLARYSAISLLAVAAFARIFVNSFQSCKAANYLIGVLEAPFRIGIHGLLIARVYAISGQNRIVLGVLSTLTLSSVVIGLIRTIITTCTASHNSSRLFLFVGGVVPMLFDFLIFAATALYIYQLTYYQQEVRAWRSHPYIIIVVQQGLIRFGFMLTVSLASVLTTITLRNGLTGFLNGVQDSLSVVLVCRFHLDLQAQHEHVYVGTSFPDVTLTSFCAATQKFHHTVLEEFGDLHLNQRSLEPLECEGIQSSPDDELQPQRARSWATDDAEGRARSSG